MSELLVKWLTLVYQVIFLVENVAVGEWDDVCNLLIVYVVFSLVWKR